jgi:HD-GYP domain-containing protein (c-di-GMP phosphodiesterase class II)
MSRKTVSVEELRLGMYVAELDRPWLGTPFPFQGFPITSEGQIVSLKKHCTTVEIDLDKGVSDEQHDSAIAEDRPLRGPTVYPQVTNVEQELDSARDVYSALEGSIQECLESLRSSASFDPEPLKVAVRSMTRSIVRNPDAMMLLFRIKERSGEEFNRAVDTSIHMITFGRFLGFPGERLLLVGIAGLLLNIGKVKLPDPILLKKEPLTADEYALAKEHVLHSVQLVSTARDLPDGVEKIVAEHHERLDGSGYPLGLKGREISVDSAIAGLIDTYSALTSLRPYAEQLSPSNALGALYKLRGKQFGETLVENFIQCIGIYPVGSAVEMNSGEIGLVIAQNITRRLQPRVMLVLDRDSRPIQHLMLDLMTEPRTASGEPYRIVRTLPKNRLPEDLQKYFF